METARWPILSALRGSVDCRTICPRYKIARTYDHFVSHLAVAPPPPPFPSLESSLGGQSPRLNRLCASASSSPARGFDQSPARELLAVLLEVEGVLVDVRRLANREAFNVAFRKMGLDCANWTEPIYLDLKRKSASNEEMMLMLFFDKIGWPTSLPTSEKGTFLKIVLQEKKNALDDFLMSKPFPLRPGAEDFINDAHRDGVPVVVLTAYSTSGDKIARSIIERLGNDGVPKVKIVGNKEVAESFYGQLVLGKGVSSSLDEQLAKEATKAASAEKQRIAEEVASMLKLSVDIDMSSIDGLPKIVAALRAGAEYAEVPVPNCVLVAGSQSGVAAAQLIGMPSVVLRSSSTSRAEFPLANAIMDGFGGADLTISRLRNRRWC